MKKTALMLLLSFAIAEANVYAADGSKDKCKKDQKCTEKSCCKKPTKAEMLKKKKKA